MSTAGGSLKSSLQRAADYAGQIDLFLGLERDLDALPSPEPYEYLIGKSLSERRRTSDG